jgi:two-component system, LytTR family, sensor kinase
MPQLGEERPKLAPRVALLSIAAFWLFYFSIVSLRSALIESGIEPQGPLAVQRIVVCTVSAATTVLLYLVLRRWAVTTMRRNIVVAALLAAPAALVYATANYLIFDSHLLTQIAALLRNGGETGLQLLAPVAPGDWDMTPSAEILGNAVNGYFYFATWAALYLLLCHGIEMRWMERHAAELRAAAQSAELRALRYQINPHFLFNTLNSLSALVMGARREAAERMIGNLSAFFRMSLAGDPTADIALSEEVFLQQLYLEIESARFPDRLAAAIDIPETLLNLPVPGMILQPLVENAVKHGAARSRAPVTIRIAASTDQDRLYLRVENDGGDGSIAPEAGNGIGLQNVRDRLAARYGASAGLETARTATGYRAEIVLPIGAGHG